MNWREGLRRIVKLMGWTFIAIGILWTWIVWQDVMTDYYPGRGEVWSWANWRWALSAAFKTFAGFVGAYLLGMASVRAARWIADGFASKRQDRSPSTE